ncbi:GNAT family N-acetyltransferase [Psychromonas sp. KJ10-10]|uniref:GNAT family N-acetyltransferase n=1 Tax=Psychromonas sp. KJ10-10 TaxID=3391823 RepID=UPI0039B525DE
MKVVKAMQSSQTIVENLMQIYLHEISEHTGQSILSNGKYDLGKYFSCYWTEAERYPYLCLVNNEPIGFALVRQLSKNHFCIAEFFVKEAYRRKSLATQFAHALFNLHSGTWQVAQLETHKIAQVFWRKTISSFTSQQFSEQWSESQPKGPMQVFSSIN